MSSKLVILSVSVSLSENCEGINLCAPQGFGAAHMLDAAIQFITAAIQFITAQYNITAHSCSVLVSSLLTLLSS